MRKLIAFLGLVALILLVSTRISEGRDEKKAEAQKPDPKKVKELMHRKLEHSQKLLEALVLNDLDKAAQNAEALIRVRKEAAWKIVKTEEYDLWSNDFDRSARGIIQAAKDKNLENAKLHYLGMTLACFHCHTYVRDLGKISVEGEDLP